jgi:hypothetical protein
MEYADFLLIATTTMQRLILAQQKYVMTASITIVTTNWIAQIRIVLVSEPVQ